MSLSSQNVSVNQAGSPRALGDAMEAALNEVGLRSELAEQLIHSSMDGILAFDRDYRYTIWNPVMERISGVDAADALGKCAFDLFPFLKETGEDHYFREVLAGRANATLDRKYIVPETGKEGYFEAYYSPLRGWSGDVIGGLGIVRDVTERKKLEQQRKALEGQLRHAQKMEAFGQLAGGVAHDFNNLLTVVLGNAGIALTSLRGGLSDKIQQDVEDSLHEIHLAGERGAALTQQLLLFSRKQPLRPEILDVNGLIQDMDRLLKRLIGDHVTIETALAPELSAVRADRSQLEQSILNLVLNSRDAMPNGGRIVIGTQDVELTEAQARTHVDASPGRYVQIDVTDQGVGMTRDMLRQVFEPFFTTKPVGKGTGLGLATVYSIVKQAGGHINVQSEPGRGSKFSLHLPALPHSVASPPRAAKSKIAGGSETVLLCEDDEAVARLAYACLKNLGYKVIKTGNAAEALDAVARHSGAIDLLVTDIVMPGLSGWELARRLCRQRPGLRTLFMSGYSLGTMDQLDGFATPVEILRKPFPVRELAQRVRDVLDRVVG